MSRIYKASFSNIAVTALQDLFEILAPSDAVVKVHRIHIGQTSDFGDAQEEILRVETVRGVGAVTSGSGGSAVTPSINESGDPAFGGTVERNNTTRLAAGSGTLTTLEQFTWNVRIPFDLVYTPEERPTISPGNYWTVSLPTNPIDSITMSGEVVFEEIGG